MLGPGSFSPTPMFSLRPLHRAAPLSASSLRICSNCLGKFSNTSARSIEQQQEASKREKQVIFSGIQPTGVPHIGNYLGALRQWVKLQEDASADSTLLFSVVDLHAITIKQDPQKLAKSRKEMLASLLAVGLDPKRCIIFAQSSVKQHAELMWMLSCGASMGYLARMTQWKVCSCDMLSAQDVCVNSLSRIKLRYLRRQPHPLWRTPKMLLN